MKKYKVSIITVCFNSEKTIERTIKSVLEQKYDNYEYIIIDGGSIDNTLNIVNKYKKILGEKMLIISEADNGIYDAMNKGIKLATGEIIGIINSDDWYEKDALETIVSYYNGNDNTILYGLLRQYKNGKVYQIKGNSHNYIADNMIPHPTCFVPKKIYDQFGYFSLKYKIVSDYELMLRLSNVSDVSFFQIEKVLANFTIGGTSNGYKALEELIKLKKEYNIISKKKILYLKIKIFYIKYFKRK